MNRMKEKNNSMIFSRDGEKAYDIIEHSRIKNSINQA
jgi:hypothetical protein